MVRFWHRGTAYWLLDPDTRTVEVYGLVDGTYVRRDPVAESNNARSTILPEFVVNTDWLSAFE